MSDKNMISNRRKYDKYAPANALRRAFEIFDELGQEIIDKHDDLPESLQVGERAQMLLETAEALSSIDAVELPQEITNEPVFSELVVIPALKSRASREDRFAYAIAMLQDVRDDLDFHAHEGIPRSVALVEAADAVIRVLDQIIAEAGQIEFGVY